MTQLYEIKVRLSPNQKQNLSKSYHEKETIVLRLTKDSLSGNDTLYVPQNIVKRLIKNRKLNKGMDIKLTKTNIRKQVNESLSKIGLGAPQMGQPKQRPRRSPPKPSFEDQYGGLILVRPPPFYGNWPDDSINIITPNLKKSKKKSLRSVLKPKFHKNIPLSNYDLIDWCKYLDIPINDVLSRDETVPHNHSQALFIYNLEPAYMTGSHWVATYVKDNVINYFDSFGLPPFQEMVNHARKKNLTLPHQNNQLQNLLTTTCGYFCLHFLNEMNKVKPYTDLLKVFNIHNTMKNERFIARYFKNI